MDDLLPKLFPGRAITKTAREYRLGSKGSLAVLRLAGKEGLWRDFDGEAHRRATADIIGLVALARFGDPGRRDDAYQWAAAYIGLPDLLPRDTAPSSTGLASTGLASVGPGDGSGAARNDAGVNGLGDTTSYRSGSYRSGSARRTPGARDRYEVTAVHIPVPGTAPPPRFPAIHRPVGWWEWRDAAGNLLLLTYRIEIGPRKAILPLTWCTVNDLHRPGRSFDAWWCHSIPAGFRMPPFDADRLAADPDLPVLVIEGEKTARAVRRRFAGLLGTTWFGGVGRTAGTDWSLLAGRDVFVLPDADPVSELTGERPGLEAAMAVAAAIDAVGPRSLRVCGASGARLAVRGAPGCGRPVWLAGPEGGLFDVAPPKWDIADDDADGFGQRDVERLIGTAPSFADIRSRNLTTHEG